MNVEEWLLSIRSSDREIRELQHEYRRAVERATNITAEPMSDRVMYSPRNSSEEKFVEAAGYAELIRQKINESEHLICEAFKLINSLGNAKHRMILRMYYLDGMTWEEVAEKMDMSTRYVSGKLKRQALEMLETLRG